MTPSKVLYHYTCVDHGQPGIEHDQKLRPNPHPLLPELGPVVWLTDLAELLNVETVGLTSQFTKCDRTAVRYEVRRNANGVVWWPFVRGMCNKSVVADLERDGQPTHWWVCTRPIAVLDSEPATINVGGME